ncbi:MAG: dihydrodipicolinate synthase family protein, partial [Deltaproteobacteria bacterium]|nr:dihydrodipicolinate synthase family protein [Deltaproteobacteria bacterium]
TLDLAIYGAAEGAHSVAAILPYYLASVEHGALVTYLSQVAETVDIPFLIYNFPRHTQLQVTPALLADVPHFGLKDSSGDFSLIPHTPNYFVGSDRQLLKAYSLGAKGFVSARANGHPELYAQMDTASQIDPESEASVALHLKVCDVCDTLSGPQQIHLVKESIRAHLPGYPTAVRLPLI